MPSFSQCVFVLPPLEVLSVLSPCEKPTCPVNKCDYIYFVHSYDLWADEVTNKKENTGVFCQIATGKPGSATCEY